MYTEKNFQDDLTTYVGVLAEFYSEWVDYKDANGRKPNHIAYLHHGLSLNTKNGSRVKIEVPHKTAFNLGILFQSLTQAKEDHQANTYGETPKYTIMPIDIVISAAHASMGYAQDSMINHIRKALVQKQSRFEISTEQLERIFSHLGEPFKKDYRGIIGFGNNENDELDKNDLMRQISRLDEYLGIDFGTLIRMNPMNYADFMNSTQVNSEAKIKLEHLLKTGMAVDRSFMIERRVRGSVDGRSSYSLIKIDEDNNDDLLEQNEQNKMILDLVSSDRFLVSIINMCNNTNYFRNTNGIFGADPNIKFHVNSGGFTGFDTSGRYLSIVTGEHYKPSTLNFPAGLTIEPNGTLYREALVKPGSLFGRYSLYGYNSSRGITAIPQRYQFEPQRGEYLCPARKEIPDSEIREVMQDKAEKTAMHKFFEIESRVIQFFKANLLDNYEEWKSLSEKARFVIPEDQDELLSGEIRDMIIERETRLENKIK